MVKKVPTSDTIHINARRGEDVLFRDLRLFQERLLLHLTSEIKNQEVRTLEMELLRRSSKYSFNGVTKILLRLAVSDYLPHEIV